MFYIRDAEICFWFIHGTLNSADLQPGIVSSFLDALLPPIFYTSVIERAQ